MHTDLVPIAKLNFMPRIVPVQRALLAALLLFAIAAGLNARFSGLGVWPLGDDEFYQSESAITWLREGAPRLPAGGYYVRGLLYQVADMASMSLLGDTEFAHRLPSAFAGILASAAAFLLARRKLGTAGAIVTASIVLLSSWHIAFSRIARMYSFLAVLSPLFFVALEHARTSDRIRPWLVAGLIVAASALVHASAAILATLLLLTAIGSRRSIPVPLRPWVIGSSLVLLVGASAWLRWNLFPKSVPLDQPVQMTSVIVPHLAVLSDLLGGWTTRIAWTTLAVALIVGARITRMRRILWPALACSVLLQPLLAASYVVLACVVQPAFRLFAQRRDVAVLAIGMAAGGVLVLGAGKMAGDVQSALYALDVPRLYWDLFRPLGMFLPGVMFVSTCALMAACARVFRDGFDARRDGLAMATLLGLIGVASIHTRVPTARYMYFLYTPLLIICIDFILSVFRSMPRLSPPAAQASGLATACVLFAVSWDCWPQYWTHPAGREIHFRLGKYTRFRQDWYRNFDYRSLAQAAREELRPGEQLAVTPKATTVARYFDRSRMYSIAVFGARNGIPQADGTLLEMYSGIPQVQRVEATISAAERHGRILVCGGLVFDQFLRELRAEADRRGLDLRVLYVDPSGARSLYELRSSPD